MKNWRELGEKYDIFHVFVVLLGFIAFNLVVIDFIFVASLFSDSSEGVLGIATKITKKKPKVIPTPTQIPYCPNSCLTEIKSAVSASTTTTTTTVTPTSSNSVKDHFIFLGTGTSSSSTWTTIPGAQATINISEYNNVQSIVFEAAVTNPNAGQQVNVRLYNSTTSTAVFGSTVFFDGNSSGLLTSSSISLPGGAQTYQVQMQAVLAAPANLTLSRIHITTN